MAATVARSVERHALGWLLAGSLVGVWLATLLLWPELGDLLPPLTYGRWVPLHLDWQLYGWCALPLVGALLAWFGADAGNAAVRLALAGWSLALGLGGLSWLGGFSSGKLFLEWSGWARPLLPLALAGLWGVLAHATWRQRRLLPSGPLAARGLLLLLLAGVPLALYATAGRQIYQAANPDSGGATGASLLGSTLGVIAIFGLLPALLRVPRTEAAGWKPAGFWLAWTASAAVWFGLGHGNVSHHQAGQIAGLALLFAWIPLLPHFARGFAWQPAARPWLAAAFGWWLLLVADGFVSFLPGYSERLKFTHGLVAHAHLAMAGLVTAVNFAILRQLRPAAPNANRGFWLWQGAAALQIAALLLLGWLEAAHPADVFLGAGWVQGIFALRLAAGLAMAAAALRWWRESWHSA